MIREDLWELEHTEEIKLSKDFMESIRNLIDKRRKCTLTSQHSQPISPNAKN